MVANNEFDTNITDIGENKMKKKIKIMPLTKPTANLSAEAYDSMSVLLEDVQSNFRVFAEDLSFVRKDVDEIKSSQSRMEKRQTSMEFDIIEMKGDIKKIETRQSVMEVDLKEIRKEIKFIKNEIAELKHSLTQKADLERLFNLEERVRKIEETIHH